MTDHGRGEQGEPTSPWSSDAAPGSVPMPSTPIAWVIPPAPTTRNDRASPPDCVPDARDDRRHTWWTVAAVVAVGTVAALVWRSGGDGSSPETATRLPTVEPHSTESNDPARTTTTSTSLETLPPPSDSTSRYTPVTDLRIDLLGPVARLAQPTELVMQTDDGLVHTLSLPSGRVRTVAVPVDSASRQDLGPGNSVILASPTSALIGGWERDLVMVPRTGAPVVIDPASFSPIDGGDDAGRQTIPLGWVDGPDDTSMLLVRTYDPAGDGYDEFAISDDGSATPVSLERSLTFSNELGAFGQRYVNDAGGVYRIDTDGTTSRISSGTALAMSQRFVLLRECDDSRRCTFTVEDLSTGDRRPVDWPSEIDDRGFGLSLSPTGRVIASTHYGVDPGIVLIDLFDGTTTRFPSDLGGDSITAWAPDGSGQFVVPDHADGIEFVDLASGGSSLFGVELGRIVAISARYPESELPAESAIFQTTLTLTPASSAPTGLRLATFSGAGELSVLDVDAGLRTSWTTRPLPGPSIAQLFTTGTEIAGYTASNGGRGFTSEFDSMTGSLDGGVLANGSLLPGPRPNTLWATGDAASGSGRVIVDMRGDPVEHPGLDLQNGTVLGGDSRGGLVVDIGGDVYTTDTRGGLERLTSGEVLAIGANDALVRECDERLTCEVLLVDRTTGDLTPSGLDPLAVATAIGPLRSVSTIGSMSPDGAVALIEFVSVGTSDGGHVVEKWFWFDVDSGNPVGTEPPDPGQPIIWSDDGAYGAYLADGTVHLYERDTYATIDVAASDGRVRSIAAVPTDFGTP